MPENILFVFEGDKPERHILKSLEKYYLKRNVHICATFNTDIYQLFQKIKDDEYNEFLDIVEVIRALPTNEEVLKNVKRQNISQVFLIFDYDGHASLADDSKIVELLQHFNEETGNGKLFISYPMVEAFKHLKKDIPFEDTVVQAKENIKYKDIAHCECEVTLRSSRALTHENWKYIISQHSKKANHLLHGVFDLPQNLFSQEDVFQSQLIKHITPNNQVAVLCAFPLFLLDYYGIAKLKDLI